MLNVEHASLSRFKIDYQGGGCYGNVYIAYEITRRFRFRNAE